VHNSSVDHIKLCIHTYLDPQRHYRVLDLGSAAATADQITYRTLLEGYRISYVGVDIVPGHNVRRVMPAPYRIPIGSNSVDLLMSGQAFEHIPFFWATMFEIARVLRPGGIAFVAAPSRGHPHHLQDLWRFYPDGWRALAAHSGLSLLEAHADFPALAANGKNHDYASISAARYWGDSIGVFRREPDHNPGLRARAARAVLVSWANRVNGIEHVPRPGDRPARKKWHLPARPSA
jgi:SAM-dependent methyltransferase